MTIVSLILENFRNYERQEFGFPSGTILVFGPNTSGKTSLLEAIFLLATGTSPRASLDREMVREAMPFASVRGRVSSAELGHPGLRSTSGGLTQGAGESTGSSKELEVQLIAREDSSTLTTKRFKINGVGRRMGDFTGELHAVLFSPEDLDLVTGSPDRRRRFIDFSLNGVSSRYRYALGEYEKVRRRRNRLLEEINEGRRTGKDLDFWDAKLLEFGTFLQDERKKFFDDLNSIIHTSCFILQYFSSGLTVERLREFRPREIAAEVTLIGPHRDDFKFLAIGHKPFSPRAGQPLVGAGGWRDLALYGSRSEQRRAVLALKRAELEFVERKIGEHPVLLLDDIFSELDEEHRTHVAGGLINLGQAIITTADIHHIPERLIKDSTIIEL